MNTDLIILILSGILQVGIGYEIGSIVSDALSYTTTRSHVLTCSFIVLVLIVIRFVLDRWIVLSEKKLTVSKLLFDIVSYITGTVLLLATIEIYASGTFGITVSVMVMYIIFSILYEREIYLYDGVVGLKVDDPYEESDDLQDDDIVLETVDSENREDLEEVKKDNADEIEKIINKYSNDSRSSNREEESLKEDKKDFEENLEVDPEEELLIEKAEKEEFRKKIYEIVKILAVVASVMVGVLTLVDIQLKNYKIWYYLIIALVTALAIVLRAVSRGLGKMIKEHDEKIMFIGFSATIVFFTVILLLKSLLIGFVFLLGAYLVKIIIPMAVNTWGTGGTRKVKINIDLLSRLVVRFFVLVICMLATWLLSYGALWEIDYLIIIAISLGMQELLLKQNAVKIDKSEEE